METKLPKELLEELSLCNGVECECFAYGECECGCSADWRSSDQVVMDWMREYPDTRHEILDAYFQRNRMKINEN